MKNLKKLKLLNDDFKKRIIRLVNEISNSKKGKPAKIKPKDYRQEIEIIRLVNEIGYKILKPEKETRMDDNGYIHDSRTDEIIGTAWDDCPSTQDEIVQLNVKESEKINLKFENVIKNVDNRHI